MIKSMTGFGQAELKFSHGFIRVEIKATNHKFFEVSARLPASLACASLAVAAGVQIIRTHDVAETVQAVRMTEAVVARIKK